MTDRGGKGRTALRALLACQFTLIAGISLSFPFMTLYLHESRGLPMGTVGLAISLAVLATAGAHGLGGELADLWGCKRVMALALAGRSAFVALMAWAVAAEAAPAAIVALLAGAGFLGNLYEPAVRAWVAAEHPPSDRARAYGLLRLAGNAAWAVGPAVGGLMAGRSYALMFAITGLILLVCLGLLLAFVPPAPAARLEERFRWGSLGAAARDPRYLELCALTVAISCVMSQLVAPLSVHGAARGLSTAQIGALFAVNGVLVVLLQRSATSAFAGVPLTAAAAAGCLFYAAGWSWTGFARGWWGFAAGMAVITVGEVVVAPCLNALAANLAPERVRGRFIGFQGLSYQVGHALGPLLGGLGHERWSGRFAPAPWLAAGVIAGVAGWGFRRLGRRLSETEQGLIPEVS